MTIEEFAAVHKKGVSTIIRWVTKYNQTNGTDFKAGPKSEIPENAPKFKSYLYQKAGFEVLDDKQTTEKYGSLASKRMTGLRNETPDELMPFSIGDMVNYPPEKLAFDDLAEPQPPTENKFFNKDGSPKKKKKAPRLKKVASESKLIELDIITKAFSDNRILIFLFLIPAIECTAAFSLIAYERFNSIPVAIAFGLIGTLIGYGMGSATVITANKKERVIIEIVFGLCQVVLISSLFLDVYIVKELSLAITSMVTYFVNRYVVGNRIHR